MRAGEKMEKPRGAHTGTWGPKPALSGATWSGRGSCKVGPVGAAGIWEQLCSVWFISPMEGLWNVSSLLMAYEERLYSRAIRNSTLTH